MSNQEANNQTSQINLSYDEAVLEVESILKELENKQLPIGDVLAKSRRVVALIAHCRKEIAKVDSEVESILKELKAANSEDDSDD